MQAKSKGSDQTARMCRLICGFAGRSYHIVGNLISRLKCFYVTGSSNNSRQLGRFSINGDCS